MQIRSKMQQKIVLILLLLIFAVSGNVSFFAQTTSAGTIISNEAQADYYDQSGNRFASVSNKVSFVVRAVPRLTVTPDETEPSATIARDQRIVRAFRVCNTGNVTDSYFVSNLTATSPATITGTYFDLDNNGTISESDIPLVLNKTESPTIQTGECFYTLVELATNNFVAGNLLTIDLTANSMTDRKVSDAGKIINIAGRSAILTSPDDPELPPLKLVNQQRIYSGALNERLNYSIKFKNHGEVSAFDAALTDELSSELRYVPNSLKIDNRAVTDTVGDDEGSVNGQRIEIRFAQPIAPAQIVTVTFQATITGNIPAGRGIVNTADLSASNAPAATSNPATVIVNPAGIVYVGNSGAGAPVANARLAVFNDANMEFPTTFPPIGFEPNSGNENPFLSNQQGKYSFALDPEKNLATHQYFVNVTAENYRARLLEINATPAENGLYDLKVRALDGMPIAVASGFELTNSEVSIPKVAALSFNIPLFSRKKLEISKSSDRAQAEIGDNVNYRIDVRNAGIEPLRNVTVSDTFPLSFNYISGTARIIRNRTEQRIEPRQNNQTLTFDIGELGAGESISLTYRVRIGTNAQIGNHDNIAVAAGTYPNGDSVNTDPAKATVRISGGLFSLRQIIVGRVFVDKNGNNSFDIGEKGVADVRLYLANGSSVITDSEGLYSFPAVTEFSQVLEIDPLTIPAGFKLAVSKNKSEKNFTRLLRTPLGGGALLRQNFALIETENEEAKNISTTKTLASFDKTKDNIQIKSTSETVGKSKNAVSDVSTSSSFTALKAGEIRIENLRDSQVVKNAAMNLEVSVFAGWKVSVELNGQKIGDNNIGTTREDQRNQLTTYTFIGLGTKPGPNRLTVRSISPQGNTGSSKDLVVYGRGSAKRIEILPAKKELQASGRDRTMITVRAFDEWNNPAQDAAVAVQTTAGSLLKKKVAKTDEKKDATSTDSTVSTDTVIPQNVQQETIELTDGTGEIELLSGTRVGEAELKALLGNAETTEKIRLIPELRPTILVGLAEMSFGKNAPETVLQNTDKSFSGHLQFFYRGRIFGSSNLLTLAYDSNQPLNRIAGQDRLFQLSPFERTYAIMGDSSTRFQESESNSKVYARLDRGRNYALFGDFEADLDSNRLLGYSRRLTGVKLHLEGNNGDFVTVTGARPDTAFARQVIPGGSLSFVRLDYADILPGSDVLYLEVRDRRNPEIIIEREPLSRGVDYNIDLFSGSINFLRPITAFDYLLNLIQVVATYEYRATGISSGVYTARGVKSFEKLGLKFGFSAVEQRQKDDKPFRLLGGDFSLKLPNDGNLTGEFAVSRGFFNNSTASANEQTDQNGNAFFLSLDQPLPKMMQGVLKGEFSSASENFSNPFGATITPGATRGLLGVELKPLTGSVLKVNLIGEKNKTVNVDNRRITAGINWSQMFGSRVRVNFGYDFRDLSDNLTDQKTRSNLLTVGAEWKPTDKLEFSVKREQNLSEPDPSYPDQTTFSVNYAVNDFAKLFFTQRLASAEISPIADLGGTGFAVSRARHETAIGIESKLGKFSTLVGRYQLENGIDSSDSFAIVGLNHRLPLKKTFAFDFGYERGFHIAGTQKSFNNIHFGTNWTPSDSFKASARYELRDRQGLGQSFSVGAAGILKKGWTTLARFQFGKVSFNERQNRILDGHFSFAVRPHDTDRYGMLFSYNYRNSFLSGRSGEAPTRLRADILSADAFYQFNPRLQFYMRTAAKVSGDGNQALPFASTSTFLVQNRIQYLLTNSFDVAGEMRTIFQPAAKSVRQNYGLEAGYWLNSDLRFGVGYNFRKMSEPNLANNSRGGIYFTVTTKLSNIFNLFGTPRQDKKTSEDTKIDETALIASKKDK